MSAATSRPFFSLVVPTYNRAHLLVPTLQSLLNQDYDRYEILVVDDGSTDNTEAVVQPLLGDRLRYYRKENGERGAARNYGAQRAQGDYICYFDSDDLAMPNHLAEAAAMVALHQGPEAFHLGYDIRTPQGRLIRQVVNSQPTANMVLLGGNLLCPLCVFVRKDIALQYPFVEDRGLAASEDYELWLRLAARFPLFSGRSITSTLVDHEGRSVVNTDKQKLLRRGHLLIQCLAQDAAFMKTYGRYFRRIKANRYVYMALHLALTGRHKWDALRYLVKGFGVYPGVLGFRMFYGTLKHLLLTWR